MRYLIIPHLRVQRANALATPWIISTAPVFACTLLAHAIGRDVGVQPEAVGIVHHDAQLLAESDLPKSFGDHFPHQYRGASYIDKDDYSSKNKHALSLQPAASMHLELSLVLAYEEVCPAVESIRSSLRQRRVAGGLIAEHGNPVVTSRFEGKGGVWSVIRSGHWLIDRSSELVKGDQGRVASLLALVNDYPPNRTGDQKPKRLWLTPAVMGYAAITPFAKRKGARGGFPHTFAEPLVGLVEYQGHHQTDEADPLLWRGQWLHDDVFAVRSFPISQLQQGE